MDMATARKHTISAFDAELDELRSLICAMAERAQEALARSMDALEQRNVALARKVCDDDERINELQRRVEALAVRTLAIRAPMADDLRTLVAAIKIAQIIERIGDYARNIARCVPHLTRTDLRQARRMIAQMGGLAARMLTNAAGAYAEQDPDAAAAVLDEDIAIDDLHDRLTVVLVEAMTESPRSITAGTHLMVIGKQIERIGDQATNVAEAVYYAATGDRLPDRKRGGASAG